MDIKRLRRKVNNREHIRWLINHPLASKMRRFLLTYGYLLNEENIREILISPVGYILIETMAAYVPSDMLDELPTSVLSYTLICHRLSRKQIEERKILNEIYAMTHYNMFELCACVNIPERQLGDSLVRMIAGRRLYNHVIKNGAPLESAPYVFKHVIPYINARQMHRLISSFWKQYKKTMRAARDYDVIYTADSAIGWYAPASTCKTFAALLPYTSLVSARDAIRFAHIMLTRYDHIAGHIMRDFPVHIDKYLSFLPHHRLMYLLINWAANNGAAKFPAWRSNTVKRLSDCLSTMMRRGRLCARMPDRLRIKTGLAFPDVIRHTIFTRQEMTKLAALRGIDKIGCDR